MRLLVAYDGSPASVTAIAFAGALFAPAEAVVAYIREPELHAVPGLTSRVRLSAEAEAAGLAEIERCAAAHASEIVAAGERLARDAGLDPRGRVATGKRPWRALAQLADQESADVIVTGAHGHTPFARAFPGSTASGLLHHAATPVLVVPARAVTREGPVIVADDGSAPAEAALRFACEHVAAKQLLVAHVWRSPVRHSVDTQLLRSLPSETVHEFISDYDAAFESAARESVERTAALARSLGVPAEARTVESPGTPWSALLRLADEEHAPLIVAGAERTGMAAVLGSVSSGLVHHASGAILIVPRHATSAAAGELVSAETRLPVR